MAVILQDHKGNPLEISNNTTGNATTATTASFLKEANYSWKPNYSATNVSNPTWLVGWNSTDETLEAVNRSTLKVSYSDEAGVANLPINAIYIQFKGQQPPAELFGGEWDNITSQFAGQFFRAEGGNAASFGSTQDEQLPNIKGSTHSGTFSWGGGSDATGSGALWPSEFNRLTWGPNNKSASYPSRINFDASKTDGTGKGVYIEGGHVIPYNSTIRIWKRNK